MLDSARSLQDQLIGYGEISPQLRRSQALALNESAITLSTLGEAVAALAAAHRLRGESDAGAADLRVEFLEGETIWTESSHKYSADEVFQMASSAGFRCEAQWIDEQWPFAENLLIAE